MEVREDIAQGMEYVKQHAEEVVSRQEEAVQSASTAIAAAATATDQAKIAASTVEQATANAVNSATDQANLAKSRAEAAASSAASAAASQTAAASSASAAKDSEEAAAKSASDAKAVVSTDTTLTVSGAPADAKITGDRLASVYSKEEADAKFGTPYTLPAATASTLGGVKVGDYLDIDADGTISGKTLHDTIAASVAVKSEARLVWTYGKFDIDRDQVHTYQAPSDVDYFVYKYASSTESVTIPRGNTVKTSVGQDFTIVFQTDGTIVFTHASSSYNNRSYVKDVTFTGYHYPTLADLLTETQAAQADTDALMVDQEYRVTLLELGLTDDTDNTSTT